MTEREALVEVLASGGSLDLVEAGDATDALLASDWLAEHDAQVWDAAVSRLLADVDPDVIRAGRILDGQNPFRDRSAEEGV